MAGSTPWPEAAMSLTGFIISLISTSVNLPVIVFSHDLTGIPWEYMGNGWGN